VAIMDFVVAMSAVISLYYLTGRYWDWVCCYGGVISVFLVARQAIGKA
jgi:hypothetical protein